MVPSPARTSPSVEKLAQAFNLPRDVASRLKSNLKRLDPENALEMANEALGGFGVEGINGRDTESTASPYYWQDAVLLYVNMGDTYDPTIVYDVGMDRIEISSWGGWVEWAEGKGRLSSYRRRPSKRCTCRGR
jgi:hypothetical protein